IFFMKAMQSSPQVSSQRHCSPSKSSETNRLTQVQPRLSRDNTMSTAKEASLETI
ncbi:hypothetical protein P7K49_030310, partial [Saguinus oedipus]